MKEIEPPDLFHLSAAIGWMELGNPAEARGELQKISAAHQEHPHVLEWHWTLAAEAKTWAACREIGETMVRVAPELAFGWIHRAYALHEMKQTQEAWRVLLPAAKLFPRDFLIPYNLSCYAAQMEKLDEARFWLNQAITIGGKKEIKKMALQDEDLKMLWPEMGKL